MKQRLIGWILAAAMLSVATAAPAQLSQAEIAEATKWLNMFATGGGGEWTSITIPEIQSALDLNANQRAQVDRLIVSFRDEMHANIQNAATMNARCQATKDEFRGKVDRILTADQGTRYRQLNLQLIGMSAVLVPGIQATLGLSDREKSEVNRVYVKHHPELWDSYTQIMGTPVQKLRGVLEPPQAALDRELASVVSAKHKTALAKLCGQRITLPPSTAIYRALRAYHLP